MRNLENKQKVERERERERDVYIYIYVDRERDRQREGEKLPSLKRRQAYAKRLRGPQKAGTPKAQILRGKPFTPGFRVLGFRV